MQLEWERSQTTAAKVLQHVKHHMLVQGYVRWTDIAKAVNVNQSRISAVKKQMLSQNLCTPEDLSIWNQSLVSNTTRVDIKLNTKNLQVLKAKAEALNLNWVDVLNRLLYEYTSTEENHDHPLQG